MRTTTLVAATLLLLALPAAAQAGAPITIGTAVIDNPRMAVSEVSGQHHIVWPSTSPGQVGYCRIKAGDAACNQTHILSVGGIVPATSFNGVDVSTWGTNQVVVHAGCDNCGGAFGRVVRFSSNNDGATFPGLPTVANTSQSFLIGQGVLEQDMFYVGTGGTQIHAMPPGGAAKPLVGDIPSVRRTETDRVPGTNQLVFATSGGVGVNAIKTSHFDNVLFNAAAINTQGNWTGPNPLPAPTPSGHEVALTAGPARLAMLQSDSTFNANTLNLRLWDPVAKLFSPPSPIQGDERTIGAFDGFTDATGVLHASWFNPTGGARLRYRKTATDGLSFGPVTTIASGETMNDVVIGREFVAWRGAGNAIRVATTQDGVPDAPPADPPAPPGPPGPGPGPGPVWPGPVGSERPTPDPEASGYAGPEYVGRTRTVRTTDSRARYDLEVPRGCVLPGQRFRVTLKWKRVKKKGNVFVKVRRADFYLGSKRVKKDTKAGFTHTYRLEASAVPGTTVQLRTKAYIKVRRGKSPTKSMRSTVKVCQGAAWPDPSIYGYPHATYPGPTKRVSSKDRLAQYRLSVPGTCIRPGQKFRVTATAVRRSKNFRSIQRAEFSLAGSRVSTDTRASFRGTYTLPAATPASASVELTVTLTPNVRSGAKPSKTVRATVTACR